MRTRTSWGRGSRTATSSRTSSSPVQTIPLTESPSSRPDERLELAVGVHGEAAAVAADARELEAAEGGLRALLGGVDGDAPRAQLAGDAHAPGGVAGEDVVVEAEVR